MFNEGFSKMGIRQVHLTGNEPMMKKNLSSLLQSLSRLPGIDEVVMTNTYLLDQHPATLYATGLRELNFLT